jgi:uncharacterized protein with NRDE domain
VCLILFAHRAHPRYRLVVAANRDEWFRRPSAPAAFWPERPDLLAGRDLEQGGTWLGVTRAGRFAALTNYRDPRSKRDAAPSRGALVTGFLAGEDAPGAYAERLAGQAARYNGFNLLAADGDELACASSRAARAARVEPGVHGLSNGVLDEPWPKVRKGRERLAAVLAGRFEAADLFALLKDESRADDAELPATGVSLEWERQLSAMHIRAEGYGTRCATVVLVDADGTVAFHERTFDPDGRAVNDVEHRFTLARA